ncbi:MAG: shikimate kinase [Candidatus Saganbacteria bacterium]|nr:shikimate kinase [Candidatus Saganbacteria bacterium]
MRKRDNIILIGFMATGKSAVGRLLAKKLKMKFICTDSIIEKKTKKKISAIFSTKGEGYFRRLETEVLRSLKEMNGAVIACGGGMILKAVNRKMLKKTGKVFLLSAGPGTINKRLKKLGSRPLLNIKDEKKRIDVIRAMLIKRDRFYKNTADHIIKTDNKTINQIISFITKN